MQPGEHSRVHRGSVRDEAVPQCAGHGVQGCAQGEVLGRAEGEVLG